MDNPPKVAKGNRVRVVLEGKVTYVGHVSPEYFEIATPGQDHASVRGNSRSVVSVEVLPKALVVGDVFIPAQNEAQTRALPVGTVMLDSGGAMSKLHDLNWYYAGSEIATHPINMERPRTIVYLPE